MTGQHRVGWNTADHTCRCHTAAGHDNLNSRSWIDIETARQLAVVNDRYTTTVGTGQDGRHDVTFDWVNVDAG